jgi:hypothetical protein
MPPMLIILMLMLLTCLIMLLIYLMFSRKNKFGRVVALYVGPDHKRPNTCVWVLKVLVVNVKGNKQVWVPKNKAGEKLET